MFMSRDLKRSLRQYAFPVSEGRFSNGGPVIYKNAYSAENLLKLNLNVTQNE